MASAIHTQAYKTLTWGGNLIQASVFRLYETVATFRSNVRAMAQFSLDFMTLGSSTMGMVSFSSWSRRQGMSEQHRLGEAHISTRTTAGTTPSSRRPCRCFLNFDAPLSTAGRR